MASYEAFEQREALTTRLANILREYSQGVSLFREFVQNADDARASRFAIILDLTGRLATGTPEMFDANDPLARLAIRSRGPAIYLYNDSVFTDRDFQSISAVGASGKAGQGGSVSVHNTTGKPSPSPRGTSNQPQRRGESE